jgi:hypothetical protein
MDIPIASVPGNKKQWRGSGRGGTQQQPGVVTFQTECQGCGSLCFNAEADSSQYNRFLNYTGLSEQGSAYQELFPAVPMGA